MSLAYDALAPAFLLAGLAAPAGGALLFDTRHVEKSATGAGRQTCKRACVRAPPLLRDVGRLGVWVGAGAVRTRADASISRPRDCFCRLRPRSRPRPVVPTPPAQ